MTRPTAAEEGISPRSLERTTLVVGALLTLASLFWWSAAVTAGVAIGAAVVWLNFRWLRRIVAGALEQAAAPAEEEGGGSGRSLAAARLAVEFVVKFGVLVALIYVLVRHTGVDVVGLLVGLSSVVVAVFVELPRHRPAGRGDSPRR